MSRLKCGRRWCLMPFALPMRRAEPGNGNTSSLLQIAPDNPIPLPKFYRSESAYPKVHQCKNLFLCCGSSAKAVPSTDAKNLKAHYIREPISLDGQVGAQAPSDAV